MSRSNSTNTSCAPAHHRILLIGYGNPGRQDDGLGAACIEDIEYAAPSSNEEHKAPEEVNPNTAVVTKNIVYQLSVEDAFDMAQNDCIVFIDASVNGSEPFEFNKISKTQNACFGSHSLNPQAVMELCDSLYARQPDCYLLAIRGYEFDHFEEALSKSATANLSKASIFLSAWLANYTNHNDMPILSHA